jgi:hypothetical protein
VGMMNPIEPDAFADEAKEAIRLDGNLFKMS